MSTLSTRRRATTLSIESLESRTNLSTMAGLPHTSTMSESYLASVLTRSKSERLRVALGDLAPISSFTQQPIGATTLGASSTAVGIGSYSGIYNCRLETRSSGQDIGYVSTAGAYVEYQVSAATAGSYAISLGVAGLNTASIGLSVNGNSAGAISSAGTGSWDSYRTTTTYLSLAAGTNTIRLSALYGTQYNLNAVSFTRAAATTNVAPSSSTAIPLASYSAISNNRLETRSSGIDLGYVSTAGAYVDYVLNVASAGTYTLNLATASTSSATMKIYANSSLAATVNLPSTGSWDTYRTTSANVYLPAGTVTLRLASAYGTQYNLSALSLAASNTTSTPVTQSTNPVAVGTSWMTSFTQLNVTGTSGNDSILVTQSGSTVYVIANGKTQSVSGSFGNLVVKGVSGNDTITVDSSVTIPTLVYAGNSGTSTIKNLANAKATIVAIGNGGGADSITGNGINTSYWVDSSDTITASSSEWNAGRVHQISSFYNNVSTQLLGQNLADPVGTGTTVRLPNASLWGTRPVQEDVNQGQLSNCFFTAPLEALAKQSPDRLQEMAVDLGDGTYAVQFVRNGAKTFVRVDADLPASGPYAYGLMYAHPGSSGNQWAPIMEKAYAFFRTGAGTYSSINLGYPTAAFSDLGVSNTGFTVPTTASTAYSSIAASLAAGKSIVVGTGGTIYKSAPLAAAHGYSLIAANKDAWGNVSFTLRNPWGFDGAGNDGNTNDGLITLTYDQLAANNFTSAITL